jgi:hypothetical protein
MWPKKTASCPRFERNKMKKNYQKAPDPTVTLSDNSTKRLSEFWRERPLVLVFLRHFG